MHFVLECLNPGTWIEFVARWLKKIEAALGARVRAVLSRRIDVLPGWRRGWCSSLSPILPGPRFYHAEILPRRDFTRTLSGNGHVGKRDDGIRCWPIAQVCCQWPLAVLSAAVNFSWGRLVIFKTLEALFALFKLTSLWAKAYSLCDKMLQGLDPFKLHAKLNVHGLSSIVTVPTLCYMWNDMGKLGAGENGIWENVGRRHIFTIIRTHLFVRVWAQSDVDMYVHWDNTSVKF